MTGIQLNGVAVWLRQTYSIYEQPENALPHLQCPNAWSIRIVDRESNPDLGGRQLHAGKCQFTSRFIATKPTSATRSANSSLCALVS